MFTIRKIFKWEGAHRLMSSYSKECQQVHGHSYKAEIIISAKELNEDGMVIDFKRLKEIVAKHMDRMDHRLLLHKAFASADNPVGTIYCQYNPTAENMCKDIWDNIQNQICKEIPSIRKLKVRIHETDTGWAEYSEWNG